MKRHNYLFTFLALVFLTSALAPHALAMNPIIRSFSSVRAQGMGNVRYTTGIYEENFYANPARITANPASRFQLPKLSFEVGSEAITNLSAITKSKSDNLQPVADTVGKPLSARFQMVFPGYYKREFITDKWTFGLGMMMSAQTVAQASQSGNIDPGTVFNAGPALTVGRRLMEEDRLSVGLTAHTEFRGSIHKNMALSDFLSGSDIKPENLGGNGLGADFDVGTTFRTHWTFLRATYLVGFAINNVLGGYYKNLSRPITSWNDSPVPSYRSYNFGVSGNKDNVWIFDNVLLAVEFTDIGNNPNGSMFRTIHIGSEAKWKVLAARLGINQGYFTGGFGVDLHYFDLNFATYGEEMGLNAGDLQDRRYAVELGFQI